MSFPRGPLRQLFADITQIPTIWDGDPEQLPGNKGMCKLSINAIRGAGVPDYVRTFDPATQKNNEVQINNDMITLGIKIEAGGGGAQPSYDGLQSVRSSLRRRVVLARLRGMGLSLSSTDQMNELDTVWDNQSIFASELVIKLMCRTVDDRSDQTVAYDRAHPAIPSSLGLEDTNWVQTINGGSPDNGNVPFDGS